MADNNPAAPTMHPMAPLVRAFLEERAEKKMPVDRTDLAGHLNCMGSGTCYNKAFVKVAEEVLLHMERHQLLRRTGQYHSDFELTAKGKAEIGIIVPPSHAEAKAYLRAARDHICTGRVTHVRSQGA